MDHELRERWKKLKPSGRDIFGLSMTVEEWRNYGSGCHIRVIHVRLRRFYLYDALNELKNAMSRGSGTGRDEESQNYYLEKARRLAAGNGGDTRYLSSGDDMLEMTWQESKEDERRDQFYAPKVEMGWDDRTFDVWRRLRKAKAARNDAPCYVEGLGPKSTALHLIGRRDVVPVKYLNYEQYNGEYVIDAEFDVDKILPVFEKPQPEQVEDEAELSVVA